MRKFSIESHLEKTIQKLYKKDKILYNTLMKKIEEILSCDSIHHYKNLRKPMQRFKRVHVRSSFVLIFKYDERNHSIQFFDCDHHDRIYN